MTTSVSSETNESGDEWNDPRLQNTRDYQQLMEYIDHLINRRDCLRREIRHNATATTSGGSSTVQSIEGSTAASLGAVEDGAGSGVPPAELSEPNIDFEFYEKFVSKSNRRGTTGKKRKRISSDDGTSSSPHSRRTKMALTEEDAADVATVVDMIENPELRDSDEYRELQRLLKIKKRKKVRSNQQQQQQVAKSQQRSIGGTG